MRFDPILEEKREWIVGETQRHNSKMADTMIEVMAGANQQVVGEKNNPFETKLDEIYPHMLKGIFVDF